ncbi:MAG TPA: hypothetical protein VHF25_05610 [Nitriliruptorales bacterium]|nr:hypothetical protein [Nitriliruptorales bacterium]
MGGKVVVPEPAVRQLPEWVVGYAAAKFPGGLDALRTVVVWGKLDRITWKTTKKLETELLHHFGLVYRGFFRQVTLSVHGTTVEPIDPLFVSESARYYAYDEQRAESLPPMELTVKGQDGQPDGVVRLRFSYMPPGFFAKDKSKKALGKNANPRFAVRKQNTGIIVCRHGRQIDVVDRSPLTTFVNNDRYIGIELDFPAELDEEFGVTTAKQQISFSERVWNLLREHGFLRTLEGLRTRWKEDSGDMAAEQELDPDLPRPSEQVMQEADEIIRHKPPTEDQEQEAEENLKREIDRMSKESGVDPEAVKQQKEREISARPFKVERERRPDGPFYRVEQQGGQLVLFVNIAHRFFTDVYNLMDGIEGARIRAALELLLFVLGQCELDASGQGRAWYMSERIQWSQRLNMVLTLLDEHIDLIIDEAEIEEEQEEAAVDEM